MPTVARESMPDLEVRRLARSVRETAARLGGGREEFEPFDRSLLERQVWWGRLFLDPDSQYEIVVGYRFPFQRRLAAVVFWISAFDYRWCVSSVNGTLTTTPTSSITFADTPFASTTFSASVPIRSNNTKDGQLP